jgi:hypothetical protein
LRKHEEIKAKNVETVEPVREKVTTITSQVKTTDLYNAGTAKTEHADLLGFQPGVDEEDSYDDRRGRGGRGRGGFRGGDRPPRDNERRGGRGGKRLQYNEQAFPTL